MKPILSPKELGAVIGVSESTVKRWVDDGTVTAAKTAGGHRRIAIWDAIRFIRESKAPIIRPDILGLADIEAVRREIPTGRSETERFFQYLRTGQAAEARGLLLAMYLSGESVEAIVDGPIQEAMSRIGELWKHSASGIFYEHRATDLCAQAIHQLRQMFTTPADAPVALGGSPAGDPYAIASSCASTVLASIGFHALNLGANSPSAALIAAIEENRPRLVWLSVSATENAIDVAAEVRALLPHLQDAVLVLGGRRLPTLAIPASPAVKSGSSMTELAGIARGVLSGVAHR